MKGLKSSTLLAIAHALTLGNDQDFNKPVVFNGWGRASDNPVKKKGNRKNRSKVKAARKANKNRRKR